MFRISRKPRELTGTSVRLGVRDDEEQGGKLCNDGRCSSARPPNRRGASRNGSNADIL